MILILSFCTFLLAFTAVGALSVLKSRHTGADYLLASRSLPPSLVGLSAVATTCSGYMFTGLIGFAYFYGVSVFILVFGMSMGTMFSILMTSRRLRQASASEHIQSYPGALSQWHGTNYRKLRLFGGLVSLIFLTVYAAAQLSAGGKALQVLLDWQYAAGTTLGTLIVLIYCFSGGIRASVWTDTAQSIVMMVSMLLLVIVALVEMGGVDAFVRSLAAVGPEYVRLYPEQVVFGGLAGPLLFTLGWLFTGAGISGQPHVMVRYMMAKDDAQIGRANLYYFVWYLPFFVISAVAGLAARVLLPELGTSDTELALPLLSMQLLPQVLVGLILAGLFAATMSTADSQILSCSAALTQDIAPGRTHSERTQKLATLLIAASALAIALWGSQSVFTLVLVAWSVLAGTFTPLLIVYVLGGKPSERLALAMAISGFITAVLWRWYGLNSYVGEAMPAILIGLALYAMNRAMNPLSSLLRRPSKLGADLKQRVSGNPDSP